MFVNQSDSQNSVVTTIAPVLSELLSKLEVEMPDCNMVYDPELTYESAISTLRDNSNFNDAYNKPIPLLAWRRSVLVPSDDAPAGRRLPYLKSVAPHQTDPNSTRVFMAVEGKFNFEYIYFVDTMLKAEQFEIAHAAQAGITGIRKLSVPLDEGLGSFEFVLQHEVLNDLTVNFTGNFHKALAGIISVRGVYFVFKTSSKRILDIVSRLSTYRRVVGDGQLLSTTEINS